MDLMPRTGAGQRANRLGGGFAVGSAKGVIALPRNQKGRFAVPAAF